MIGVGDRDRERGERKEKESTSDKTKQVRLRTAAQSLEQIFSVNLQDCQYCACKNDLKKNIKSHLVLLKTKGNDLAGFTARPV